MTEEQNARSIKKFKIVIGVNFNDYSHLFDDKFISINSLPEQSGPIELIEIPPGKRP